MGMFFKGLISTTWALQDRGYVNGAMARQVLLEASSLQKPLWECLASDLRWANESHQWQHPVVLQLHSLTLLFCENRERAPDTQEPFLRGSWGREQALNNTGVRKNHWSEEPSAHLLPGTVFEILYEISIVPGYWRRAELFKAHFFYSQNC